VGGTDPVIWRVGADEVLELCLPELLPHTFVAGNLV
jgi:hypothetical protein